MFYICEIYIMVLMTVLCGYGLYAIHRILEKYTK